MFTVKIAEIAIGIDNRYSYVEEISRDYLTDDAPSFTLSATEKEIDYERTLAEGNFPVGVLESTAIYRKMAEKLADYDAFIFHGAVIEFKGRAYLFTAKSGVGKTTHIRLWQKRFGAEVSILNGDKPVLRVIDGEVFASGTPWRGKEGYGKPGITRLSGIAFIERSGENKAFSVKADEVIMKFATQAYIPRTDSAAKILSLFDKVLSRVPLIVLGCNMNPDAAEVAYSAFMEAEIK
ncbi:MAG: hypothetical protein IJW38_01885 [Clostridia bacterium]|nr:hypothetical protein [Clostridia bacterium]